MRNFLVAVSLVVLSGCGGGGGSSAPSASTSPLPAGKFWASDFTTASISSYQSTADKVAEGAHCYVYLEQGQSVPQADIDRIRNEFDKHIYPAMVTGFGNEPNPGIDNDPKIIILLLAVKDGSETSNSYVAGYFDPANEYAQTGQNPHSNQKEILYMNIKPGIGIVPTSNDFFTVIAHEFQHMIHWEQKTHLRNLLDDVWLDEAMATVARTYCGYGPDYGLVLTYEFAPFHSLVDWDGTALNYGVVYMWSQYFKDRIGSSIFFQMLHNNQIGISSVNAALAAAGYSQKFHRGFP